MSPRPFEIICEIEPPTCAQIQRVRDSGAFAGVHLVPVSRYRQVAARLEILLGTQPPSAAP